MNGHTASPWVVVKIQSLDGWDTCVEDARNIAVCGMNLNEPLSIQWKNANLIAAAPDLLAVAKMAVCYMSGGSLYPELFVGHEADSGDIFLLNELKAAIAKSDGKTAEKMSELDKKKDEIHMIDMDLEEEKNRKE